MRFAGACSRALQPDTLRVPERVRSQLFLRIRREERRDTLWRRTDACSRWKWWWWWCAQSPSRTGTAIPQRGNPPAPLPSQTSRRPRLWDRAGQGTGYTRAGCHHSRPPAPQASLDFPAARHRPTGWPLFRRWTDPICAAASCARGRSGRNALAAEQGRPRWHSKSCRACTGEQQRGERMWRRGGGSLGAVSGGHQPQAVVNAPGAVRPGEDVSARRGHERKLDAKLWRYGVRRDESTERLPLVATGAECRCSQ